ncbi:hypothetical protein [Rhizobium sp. Root482]|uniref:hypothetical protein n=1 Tax=Rhizobium sp. Root482 TaxID=1736543 RepID=UPI0009E71100|nr:hypothetical protein [Rhizobium sp. Root482]
MFNKPTFVKLNTGWNAEPNAPFPEVIIDSGSIQLRFYLNPWIHVARPGQKGTITFVNCSRWRLGLTNDEGWYRGQCRYSRVAPEWGHFYELIGDDDCCDDPQDWISHHSPNAGQRHFLFYFRDETFECFCADWRYQADRVSAGPP